MTSVAQEVESSDRNRMNIPPLVDKDITSFIAREAVISEKLLDTKGIFTDAYRGVSARFIASFRGNNPTYAICHNQNVQHWLSLSYGVFTFFDHEPTDVIPRHSVKALHEIVESGRLRPSDRIAYLTGTKAGARALEFLTPAELFAEEDLSK